MFGFAKSSDDWRKNGASSTSTGRPVNFLKDLGPSFADALAEARILHARGLVP